MREDKGREVRWLVWCPECDRAIPFPAAAPAAPEADRRGLGAAGGTSGSSSVRPAWPSTSPAPGNFSVPVVEATEAPDVPPTQT